MTLRIIGGALKRKKINSVEGMHTRPTSDRVRESIFNILFDRTRGRRVLDLFAGTGAMGIEALSRGASSCTFMDNSRDALSVLKKNIESLNLKNQATIIPWDIRKNLFCVNDFKAFFDLVFMDPPYHSDLILPTLDHMKTSSVLKNEAIIVVEHAMDEPLPSDIPGYIKIDERRYGKTGISILEYASVILSG